MSLLSSIRKKNVVQRFIMKINGKLTHTTTRLCHFPEEGTCRMFNEKPRTMDPRIGFHQPYVEQSGPYYPPGNSVEQRQSPFSSGGLFCPDGNIGSGDLWDPEDDLGAYSENSEEDEDEAYEAPQTTGKIKPARKYTRKSEAEKKTNTYQVVRTRNNVAVRKSREKAKKEVERKEQEHQEMKSKIWVLEQERKVLVGIIDKVKADLARNPNDAVLQAYPALQDLLNFRT